MEQSVEEENSFDPQLFDETPHPTSYEQDNAALVDRTVVGELFDSLVELRDTVRAVARMQLRSKNRG